MAYQSLPIYIIELNIPCTGIHNYTADLPQITEGWQRQGYRYTPANLFSRHGQLRCSGNQSCAQHWHNLTIHGHPRLLSTDLQHCFQVKM